MKQSLEFSIGKVLSLPPSAGRVDYDIDRGFAKREGWGPTTDFSFRGVETHRSNAQVERMTGASSSQILSSSRHLPYVCVPILGTSAARHDALKTYFGQLCAPSSMEPS
jgi:hypothetical protein